ncbi:MAG: hypothetical protein ACR2QM_07940 [Longimicrobiales bacterium]
MPRTKKAAPPASLGFGVEELSEPKKMERLYCSGRQVPSPLGGFLVPLGVKAEDDGTATVLLECQTSSLRYQLPIRKATRTETSKVKAQVKEGLDPLCPRGDGDPSLVRRGADWYCPRCNIKFGRAV